MWNLTGPYFVRFATRLPYYQGAVVGKIKHDFSETDDEGNLVPRDSNVESTKKVKMSEAMGRVSGDDLTALNIESQANDMGDLFERVTVPGN